mmetsp:Transcript_37173/g.91124  ORF Transcript_37173/g.91124 Transcript_37173/m.91124 type:complete len:311 (-) Transcript_37173:1183-2115(-)
MCVCVCGVVWCGRRAMRGGGAAGWSVPTRPRRHGSSQPAVKTATPSRRRWHAAALHVQLAQLGVPRRCRRRHAVGAATALVREQRLDVDVHAVAPVVLRVRRHVDLLFSRILTAQLAIKSQDVLEWKNGQHRRRVHVLHVHLFAQPRFGVEGWFLVHRVAKNVRKETLGARAVLFPPSAHGAHVVRRRRHHAAVWRVGGVAKFNFGAFWHTLNFERQNTELVHYARHTVGHHAKILTTHQHIGSIAHGGQFLHCLLAPKVIMPPKVEIVVGDFHHMLRVWIEALVGERVHHRNTWTVLIVADANKQHLGD